MLKMIKPYPTKNLPLDARKKQPSYGLSFNVFILSPKSDINTGRFVSIQYYNTCTKSYLGGAAMFLKKSFPLGNPRRLVVGVDEKVPTISGRKARYINFDNAASTPVLRPVLHKINEFSKYYSGVHRGTGFKSMMSTEHYDNAHENILRFFGADTDLNSAILVKNATEAINKLSYRIDFSKRNIVITTRMEHHSNDLPWRLRAKPIYVKVDETGALDLDDMESKIRKYAYRVRLVAVTGASNVTGFVNDIHTIARMAHSYGGEILVDAAQLAPHRPIDMLANSDPGHIDYLAFSAHKIYAPFGAGILIGPTNTFKSGIPEFAGGGTIDSVTADSVTWTNPPYKDEAGSPNVIGIIALETALRTIEKLGMEKIVSHEQQLTAHTLKGLNRIEGVTVYGSKDPDYKERVGVISFNIEGYNHALVSAILSFEAGIGVRSGCFCAHPYVHQLLGLRRWELERSRRSIITKNLVNLPGMVRVSFGLYNTLEEVDRFLELIGEIAQHRHTAKYRDTYRLCRQTGEYLPGDERNEDVKSLFKKVKSL
jgi:cysteine desulfurase/selenocysteine lyase